MTFSFWQISDDNREAPDLLVEIIQQNLLEFRLIFLSDDLLIRYKISTAIIIYIFLRYNFILNIKVYFIDDKV